jgi:RimJ/RimL family protein N-acetyltransferase
MENYGIMLKHSTSTSASIGEEANEEKEKMIGILGVPRLSPDGAAAEVGYAILPEYWGRGFASEALVLFQRWYFESERRSPSFLYVPFLPFPRYFPISHFQFFFSFFRFCAS